MSVHPPGPDIVPGPVLFGVKEKHDIAFEIRVTL